MVASSTTASRQISVPPHAFFVGSAVFHYLGPAFAVLLFAQVDALGCVLAAMNACFYEAIARLPLGTVGGIEFLGPVALAAIGVRTRQNLAALVSPGLLAAGFGVGICSSVIQYVCDQLAMARLPRATFALLLALLPATAAIVGLIVLAQLPSATEWSAIALIVAGVALHREQNALPSR